MKNSNILLSFLLFSLISDASLAAAFMRQDSQSQEKREASQSAKSAEEGDKAISGTKDASFLGSPIVAIEFRGNKDFTSETLFSNIKYVKLGKPFKPSTRE